MPTYYVEDYDGERNKDAVETVDITAKVVTEDDAPKPAPKKTASAKTK